MGNITFYLNLTKGKKTLRPIMINYCFNGQRLRYYSGLRIHEDQFSAKSTSAPAKTNCTDRIFINTRLSIIRNHIFDFENMALAGKEIPTPELIKNYLDSILKARPIEDIDPLERVTLVKYFDIFIEDCKIRTNEKTGRKLSKAMPVKYTNVKNLFNDFCTHEGRKYDFEDIDQYFYKRFVSYMLKEKKYSVNTYGRALKFLKTLISSATKAGYNTNLYYLNIKGVQEASESIYLNEAELQQLYKLDFSTRPTLDRVRDLFLIGCNTGLRFSDYTTIQPDDIQGDRLRVIAQKTNKKVIIPLSPIAKAILEKYKFQLPKAISNQKFNGRLKEVAKEAEFFENVVTHMAKAGKQEATKHQKYELVTSHVARRSFATNAYKHGVDTLSIMAITGHSTEAEFLKYIKVTGEEKADKFEKSMKWNQKQKPKAVRKIKAPVKQKKTKAIE